MKTSGKDPASCTVLSLSAGSLVLDLVPEIGGSIARLYSTRNGQIVDWMRPASAAGLAARDPLAMASFPLVPFSNRIRDGRFTFAGKTLVLPQNFAHSRHAIHGDGWRLPWEITSHETSSATLALVHPGGDWPFAYRAEQRFTLTPRTLDVEIVVTNTDARPMPLGLGHHPYFPCTPGTTIHAEVAAMWESDAELLPTKVVRNQAVADLARGLKVSAANLDNNFTGWRHDATVRWPEQKRRLRMTAEPPLSYLVVYTPQPHDFFCMEPVSNCTDWINLGHLDPALVGGTVLAPGAKLGARMRLEPEFEG